MIILGIDPGLATTGYGLIAISQSVVCLDYGVLTTAAGLPLADRLCRLFAAIQTLITRWKPDQAAIESLFFYKNTKTALQVAQARGVCLLALRQQGILCTDYTPLQVKSSVTGYGSAKKNQMQYMVQKLLRLPKKPSPDDAADGLALALCHHYHGAHSGLKVKCSLT